MRNLVLICVLLLSGVYAGAQTVNSYIGGPSTLVISRHSFRADSSFQNALRDTNFTPVRLGVMVFRPADSSLYVATSILSPQKWTKVGSGGGGSGGVWGAITGTLASQADIVAALAAKQNLLTLGTTSQYFRGDYSLSDFQSDVLNITDPLYSPSGHSHSGLAPAGGQTGYILKKNSNTSYDYSWQPDTVSNSGGGGVGDMLKSIYDADNDGAVDNSERLGSNLPAYYGTAADVLLRVKYIDTAAMLAPYLRSHLADFTLRTSNASGSRLMSVINANEARIRRIAFIGVDTTASNDSLLTVNFTGLAGTGGVNSGTLNRLAYYAATGTTVSQANSITGGRALISDANGLPTHSTATATNLNYIANLSSDAQTQITARELLSNKVTSLASPNNTTYPTSLAVSNAIGSVTAGQVVIGNGTGYSGNPNLTYSNNLFKVTNGVGGMSYPYETAIFERNGDMKLGVYNSSATPNNTSAVAYTLGYTGATLTGGNYPGMEMQYMYHVNPDSNYLTFNFLERNAAGTVVVERRDLFKIYADGTTSATGGGGGSGTAPTVTSSAATSLTLTVTGSYRKSYVFTGGTATVWTLPAIGTPGQELSLINTGTANITVQRAGSNQIYTDEAITSFILYPGDVADLQDITTYWKIK